MSKANMTTQILKVTAKIREDETDEAKDEEHSIMKVTFHVPSYDSNKDNNDHYTEDDGEVLTPGELLSCHLPGENEEAAHLQM